MIMKSLHICTDIPKFPIYIQSHQIIYLTPLYACINVDGLASAPIRPK